MKAGLCTILIVFFSLGLIAEPYYHEVKAEQGDGIFSLLRRYHLDYHPCNRQQFLNLNNLTINDHLKKGVKYKLPVMIYKYNGTSIRTTIGIDSWEQAIRIKKYNEQILKDKLRKTNYLHSNILWVPYNELNCKDYSTGHKNNTNPEESDNSEELEAKASEAIAIKGRYEYNNLFGKKHRSVEIKDNSLQNKVYYLVSGHGGPDPGARCTQCVSTLCEDEYAYDVVLRLARQLQARGAITHVIIQDKNDGIRDEEYLTCDYDETCMGNKIPLNQKKRLEQRASAINRLYKKHKSQGIKDQMAIVIHIDSNAKNTRQDVYFYHHKTSKSSKKLADSMQETFRNKYNHFQKGRGYKGFVKYRGLYMINNTLPTCTYIELANIRNAADQERLVKTSNREALAKWMYEGIVKYHE